MIYRVTFTSGAVLITEQDSEAAARDRAAWTSPRATIHSVEGFATREDAAKQERKN